MPFQVHRESRANSIGRDAAIWVLANDHGDRVEIWPALGFNAYRWTAMGQEILHCDPTFFDEVKPSRGGWPILFPFPNRIRDGRFTWDGTPHQLPLGDPSGKNAIHGFVANRPWRVVDHGADEGQAWVTGAIESTRDLLDVRRLWPGDYRLAVTYRFLAGGRLRVEAVVDNLGATPLPFGLGYHPYFRVAPFGGDAARVAIEAQRVWPLVECLPSGEPTTSVKLARTFGDLRLDDLLTDLPLSPSGRRHCGAIAGTHGASLMVEAARDFRELVVFTPPHRQAICFEPYTCATDAINLHARGIDSGLRILPPGDSWHGWVETTVVLPRLL